jgi:5-methylthioadenosine/S-adenosylhomocysteine deaminase
LVDLNKVHNQPVNDVFSQIVHCAKASDVRTVIVNGEILMRDHQLTRQDEDRILDDARQEHRDLTQRLAPLSF